MYVDAEFHAIRYSLLELFPKFSYLNKSVVRELYEIVLQFGVRG